MIKHHANREQTLDTLDSPATDKKSAFEVLCRDCKIKNRLKLKAVVAYLTKHFMPKLSRYFGRIRMFLKIL